MDHAKQLTLITETLRLPRPDIATFTAQGLAISPDASEADLVALGTRLFAVRSWTKWGLGSVFAAMLQKRPHPDTHGHPGEYDTGWVSDFADSHHLDPKERRELIGVALFYGGSSPTPHLSFEHHREAMWAASNLQTGGDQSAPTSSLNGGGAHSPAPNSPAPTAQSNRAPTAPHTGGTHLPSHPPVFQQAGGGDISHPHSPITGGGISPPPVHTHGGDSTPDTLALPSLPAESSPQRALALRYLNDAAAQQMSVSQLRAHIRGAQRTAKPEQRELSLAAYSAVFDFHRFAARELAAISDLKPERARMILADLGQESLDFISALQRTAAIPRA